MVCVLVAGFGFVCVVFVFRAEFFIRVFCLSLGLGDVYERQCVIIDWSTAIDPDFESGEDMGGETMWESRRT